MLKGEHSAILSTFIKLPFSIKTFVLSIFEWPLKTGFTVDVSQLNPALYTFKLTYYETICFLICGSKKQNASGINLVPEFITLAISIKTDYDSHLLIKHAITPVNQGMLNNDVILALMYSICSPHKKGGQISGIFSAVYP